MTRLKKIILYYLLSCITVLYCGCQEEILFSPEVHELPVINLDIHPKYLWSKDSGLYVIGENGKEGCDEGFVANFYQSWEYPVEIKITQQNQLMYEASAGFRIKGNCSRMFSMKSFGLYFRNEYGHKRMEYPIFNDRLESYKRLLLRNSGNDFQHTHLKDAVITQILKGKANVDVQNYTPSVLYLNNEYWGIYNIREMLTPHFFEDHYGLNKENIDLLEGCEADPEVDDGDRRDYMREVVAFAANNDLSIPENYIQIQKSVDIDSYMDFIIIQTYIAHFDWRCSNNRWWRDRTSDIYNRWKWIVYDTDLAFDLDFVNRFWLGKTFNNFRDYYPDNPLLFDFLMVNPSFRESFFLRYMYFIDEVFEPVRVEAIIREMSLKIEPEYARHAEKWNAPKMNSWKKRVDNLIKFNEQRNQFVRPIIMVLSEHNHH